MFQTIVKYSNGHISVKNQDIDKLISLTESSESREYYSISKFAKINLKFAKKCEFATVGHP